MRNSANLSNLTYHGDMVVSADNLTANPKRSDDGICEYFYEQSRFTRVLATPILVFMLSYPLLEIR